jgi:serine O-acetyltransferase
MRRLRPAARGRRPAVRRPHSAILGHATLEDSLSSILAGKLESTAISAMTLRDLIRAAMAAATPSGRSPRSGLRRRRPQTRDEAISLHPDLE